MTCSGRRVRPTSRCIWTIGSVHRACSRRGEQSSAVGFSRLCRIRRFIWQRDTQFGGALGRKPMIGSGLLQQFFFELGVVLCGGEALEIDRLFEILRDQSHREIVPPRRGAHKTPLVNPFSEACLSLSAGFHMPRGTRTVLRESSVSVISRIRMLFFARPMRLGPVLC